VEAIVQDLARRLEPRLEVEREEPHGAFGVCATKVFNALKRNRQILEAASEEFLTSVMGEVDA